MSKAATETATDAAKDVTDAAKKTVKSIPAILTKGLILFGTFAGGRIATKVLPPIKVLGKKISGQTYGQGGITGISALISVLTRKKHKEISEGFTYAALGNAVGTAEGATNDVLEATGQKEKLSTGLLGMLGNLKEKLQK